MPRPRCCCQIQAQPGAFVFLPAGKAPGNQAGIVLTLNEFEAIRLADLAGLHQEQACRQMQVTRSTFGRILETAHRKIARMLVLGVDLEIRADFTSKEGKRCGEAKLDSTPVDSLSPTSVEL